MRTNATFEGLPEYCFTIRPLNGRVIQIVRGEDGFNDCPVEYQEAGAEELNRRLGVTKAQEAAMVIGSMFGWSVPGANPDMYDENGRPKGGKSNG